MDKKQKLAQIADLTTILESLVKEYNEDIVTYEAHIAEIRIATDNSVSKIKTEIHLHGTTDNLGIEFALKDVTNYEECIVKDYGMRFHGVDLTDCQVEWKTEEENASMAV